LYTSSSGGTPVASILGVITGSNQFTGLTAGTTYYAALTSSNTSYYTTSPESDRFAITTNASPQSATISTQPTSLTRTSGQSFQLSVAASVSDGGTLSYQWKRGTTNVGTSTTYSETNVQAGTYTYTVEITNTRNGLTTVATSNTATVTVSSAVSFSGTTIYATAGIALTYTLSASGGLAPYTFGSCSTLPTWLSLNTSTGALTGTPAVAGTTSGICIQVTDSNYASGNAGSSIVQTNGFSTNVATAMAYTALATQSATVGTAYSTLFAVTGGRATLSYSLNSGTLPTGLSLNTATGEISGTPTANGTFTATVRATDANSATKDLAVTFTVSKGAASTPTLGTVTRTADGFTSQITKVTNYNYSATTSAGSVSIDANGLITVTGLGVNSSATVTVTSTRSGYTDGTATVTGTSSQGTTTVSVALPSNVTTATFGTAVTLTATATRAGTVTFKDTMDGNLFLDSRNCEYNSEHYR
jgi:hypothetical protein